MKKTSIIKSRSDQNLSYGYYNKNKLCIPSGSSPEPKCDKNCEINNTSTRCIGLPAYTIVQNITNGNSNSNNNRNGSGIVTLTTMEILVGTVPYNDIINFPWVTNQFDNTTNQGTLMLYTEIPMSTTLTVSVFNATSNVSLGSQTFSSTGFYTVPFTKPTTNSLINIRFTKTGNIPVVKGVAMKV